MERRKAGDGSLSCPITTALTASNGVNRDHEEMSRAERIHGFIGRPAPSRRSTHSPGRGHWVYLMRLGLQNHECKLRRTYQHSSVSECKTSKRHFAKIGPPVVSSASSAVLHESDPDAPIESRSRFSMMSLTSSVTSPAVVVTTFVDLAIGRSPVRCTGRSGGTIQMEAC